MEPQIDRRCLKIEQPEFSTLKVVRDYLRRCSHLSDDARVLVITDGTSSGDGGPIRQIVITQE